MNTITAPFSRIPRAGLIALVALVAAFLLLMVTRLGVLGGSDVGSVAVAPTKTPVTHTTVPRASAKPKLRLRPGLPPDVAHALRYSRVVVVSLYVGQAAGDSAAVAEARAGARAAGAGFVALNVGNDKKATRVAALAGAASAPTMLVLRRPGKVLTQISGPVDSTVVQQAAHNAGARR